MESVLKGSYVTFSLVSGFSGTSGEVEFCGSVMNTTVIYYIFKCKDCSYEAVTLSEQFVGFHLCLEIYTVMTTSESRK